MSMKSIFYVLVNDHGDCEILSFVIIPQRARTESTINVNMEFLSKNGTGTGEMLIQIDTVDKIPLSTSFLVEAKKPGSFAQRLSIDTTPDPDCDPTTGKCYS